MAINFPSTPSDGDTHAGYTYDATNGVWNIDPHQIASRFVASDTAPTNPQNGDAWYNTTTGVSLIYYVDEDSSQWIEFGGSQGVAGPAGPAGPQGDPGPAPDADADQAILASQVFK